MRRLSLAAGLLLVLALPGVALAAAVQTTYPVGNEPFGVAVDPRDGRVYVANSNEADPLGYGRVSVVDPATASVTAFVTSGVADFVALDAGTRRLYSSNANRTLDVFDLAASARIATLGVGGLGLALDAAAQRLYVASGRDLAVIDTAQNTLVTTVVAPTSEAWFSVALDPALHRVYVTDAQPGTAGVVVLDDRDLSRVGKIGLTVAPRFALAVDTSSHVIYVAGFDQSVGYSASMLFAFDGATLSQLASASVPGFPAGLVLDASAHRLYETDLTGVLRIVDDASLVVVSQIGLPWTASMAALHPDGRLYVAGFSADLLAAVDLQANAAPSVDSVRIAPDPPLTNDILTATVTAHDPDGDPLTFAYAWYRNGVRLAQTGATLDLSVAGNGDRGDRIEVVVVASDGQTTSPPSLTSSWVVTVKDTAPTAAVSLDTTAPVTGSILTATAAAADADGDAVTYAFTWKVNGVVRRTMTTGSATDTFDLAPAGNGQRGDVVSVELVVSDGLLRSATARADATVVNSAPTVSVTLSDASPSKRDVLTATATARDADGDTLRFTYTWRVNGKVKQITTATTASTSTLDLRAVEAEVGDTISVNVVVSDGALSAAASASAKVTPAGR